jgi:hypothetical protein
MKLSERDHPFYRPLWRRIAIVAVVAAWAGFEVLVSGDGFWTMLSLFFLGYAVWMFFISYRPKDADGDGAPPAA